MSRKSISVSEDVYDRLLAHKGADDSWTDVGKRAADALDTVDGDTESPDGGVDADANASHTLTEDHIDDIGAEVERRVERVLENATRHR
jgi:hypothetical protein